MNIKYSVYFHLAETQYCYLNFLQFFHFVIKWIKAVWPTQRRRITGNLRWCVELSSSNAINITEQSKRLKNFCNMETLTWETCHFASFSFMHKPKLWKKFMRFVPCALCNSVVYYFYPPFFSLICFLFGKGFFFRVRCYGRDRWCSLFIKKVMSKIWNKKT